MRFAYSILWLAALFPYIAFSQEYGYVHYDVADGLASSTVYCITQDKDGFIWLGTEAGVCRFDGKHFITYTTADGLPDAEILQIFADSKGRVWMAPFGGSVCYYYEGKIHSQENDSLLSAMGQREEVENFVEDAFGDILIQQKTALTVVRADGRLKYYDSAGGAPIGNSVGAGRSANGNFNIQIDQQLFELSAGGFRFLRKMSMPYLHPNYIALSPKICVWNSHIFKVCFASLASDRRIEFQEKDFPVTTHVSFSILYDSLVIINKTDGAEAYSLSGSGVQRQFLHGIHVSRTFGDRAGNIWFTSLGNGIYRLKSAEVRSIVLPENGMGVTSVHSIELNRRASRLLLGVNHDGIFALKFPGMQLDGMPRRVLGGSRILFLHEFKDNWVVYGSDALVGIGSFAQFEHLKVGEGIKSASLMDHDRVLMGGPWGAGIFDIRSRRIEDTLWRGRITVVYNRKDTKYIGTLHGQWRIIGKDSPQFMGNRVPFLKTRISAMTESADGTLWIASYDDNIMGYANGQPVAMIEQKTGLSGNICHCLYYHDGALWVGTDKGLNKIELGKRGYPVTCYTSKDGLLSDVVNVVYAVGDTIFAGTSSGLSFFDEKRIVPDDECGIDLTAVYNGGRNRIQDTAGLVLPIRQNNIRFEFAGIAYRSDGQIKFRYRLVGLDTGWKETQEGYLDYPTLPGGRYSFQVQAVNRFGVRSVVRSVPFTVATPIWNQLWFNGLELVLFLTATWLFVNWRIGRVRRQQEERSKVSRRMVELEHTALQSQMNPHFIFNSLNSIQQFVFDKDMMATNAYISSFARLIRATLNQSSRPFISVADEVAYLRDYLSLEKMRFKNEMNYAIEVEPGLDADAVVLPPMLLQPYVENCIRHGLRHKRNGQGYINIQFRRQSEKLTVTIRDNGIGRKKAMEYKTAEHIEYQSKGMSLTSSRIEMINVLYNSRIEISIEDILDSAGHAEGTKVMIDFPIFQ